MSKLADLTGKRYGRLTVVSRSGVDSLGHVMWLCKCDCGNECITVGRYLTRGSKKSCGCMEESTRFKTTHGMINTRIYSVWGAMNDRCYCKNNHAYSNYGERGITVCDEWRHSFVSFYLWAINNGYKDGLSIDRIDNNKGYSPKNCRWATVKEQNNNQRRNLRIELGGVTKTASEWCEAYNLNPSVVYARLRSGWAPERALGVG